ncbi:siderophore-interacting protein [Nocardioides oleivorans]|uniref:Siderophore-interacting protein n=1 Tax=Nocardioides oleivorans TaxID=273676 RepID=A0A4Q2S172_9ACTN|nr:siderophore-interacting protein [Nocardioides oleivorans]RYB94074.1 siderophore-interacting protein [Nocardioides oleivorans]
MSTRLTVTSTESVTPSLRRVWFRSDDLSAFAASEDTDRYVKLVFHDGVRTYTALFPDVAAGTLAIDFVVHGDEGIAGPWAQRAQPGDELEVNGPGGGYRPDPTADVHLLAGDDSAVPAISAALASLAADATGQAFVLVDDAAHEPALTAPAGVTITFLHRDAGQSLGDAVRAWPWPEGRVQAFVHGEAQEVMHGVRPYLLKERGLPRADASISGYWRAGRTEESFRVWKRELAEAEA